MGPAAWMTSLTLINYSHCSEKKQGYQVTVSQDGIDALLSYVDMPNLNGFKLLEMMNQKGLNTPVIFLTGRDNQEAYFKGHIIVEGQERAPEIVQIWRIKKDRYFKFLIHG